jgi:hypothetical protein
MASDVNIGTLQEFMALVKRNGLARTDRFVVNFAVPQDVILLCEEASFPGKTIDTRTLRINGLSEQRAHTKNYGGDLTLTFLVDNSWGVRDVFEAWMETCIGAGSTTDSIQPAAYREVGFYSDYVNDITITALTPVGSNTPLPPIPSNSPFSSANLISSAKAFATSKLNTATGVIQGNILGKSLSGIAQGLLGDAESAIFPIDTKGIPNQPTVVAEVPTYSIIVREAFPKAIDSQPMSSSSINQIHRLKVTFAYKYYTVASQAASPQTPPQNPLNPPDDNSPLPLPQKATDLSTLSLPSSGGVPFKIGTSIPGPTNA